MSRELRTDAMFTVWCGGQAVLNSKRRKNHESAATLVTELSLAFTIGRVTRLHSTESPFSHSCPTTWLASPRLASPRPNTTITLHLFIVGQQQGNGPWILDCADRYKNNTSRDPIHHAQTP